MLMDFFLVHETLANLLPANLTYAKMYLHLAGWRVFISELVFW